MDSRCELRRSDPSVHVQPILLCIPATALRFMSALPANASSHGFYYYPRADADTQVNLPCSSSHLNFRIFQLPPRYFHHPNVPRAQHARSSAPIHQLFLLCSQVRCPCSSTFTSQVPEESLFPSHPLLRYLISSIYFVFVIILPFHSYYRFPNLGCPHLLSGLQDCMLILSSPTQSFSTVFRLIF